MSYDDSEGIFLILPKPKEPPPINGIADGSVRAVAEEAAAKLGLPFHDVRRVLAQALTKLRPSPPTPPSWLIDERLKDRRRSLFYVPFMSKSEQMAPLRRVLAFAADKMGANDHWVATMFTYFLEGIADEISCGSVVRLPGFGMFGPWYWEGKKGGRAVYPRFVPSRGLRQQVRALCPTGRAKNNVLRTYQRSHHPSSHPTKWDTYSRRTMGCLRQEIERQAGYPIP